jgi:hypothetical protein
MMYLLSRKLSTSSLFKIENITDSVVFLFYFIHGVGLGEWIVVVPNIITGNLSQEKVLICE